MRMISLSTLISPQCQRNEYYSVREPNFGPFSTTAFKRYCNIWLPHLDRDLKKIYFCSGGQSIEMSSYKAYLSRLQRPHSTNKCLQLFANISFPSYTTNTLLTIAPEIAHFSLDIIRSHAKLEEKFWSSRNLEVAHDFNSTSTLVPTYLGI